MVGVGGHENCEFIVKFPQVCSPIQGRLGRENLGPSYAVASVP